MRLRLASSPGLVCSMLALCASGCGSKGPAMVPIRGEVVVDGQPLRDVMQGIVRYSPKQSGGAAREATARIQPDGSFEMTTFQKGDGVVAGDYSITVSAYSAPILTREQTEAGVRSTDRKLMIPEKYLEATTSGLSDRVDADHSGFKRIELVN